MEVKGDDPEITTPTAHIAKSPQDIKTTTIKEMIAEARDIEATERRTIRTLQGFRYIATKFIATTIFCCNKI
jgi:hypothetical protein